MYHSLRKWRLKKLFTNLTLALLTSILMSGCTYMQASIKHKELAENKIVTINKDEYTTSLFTQKVVTKGYKNLRIFSHIYNDQYESKPIPQNAYFLIIAYYAIGQGGWGYHTERFNYESTSGWSGVANIPVVGETTRVGIIGFNMPKVDLKVDVVASFH